MTRINEKRKEFSQGNNQISGNQRYHAEEVEERFAKYKPGILRQELNKMSQVASVSILHFSSTSGDIGLVVCFDSFLCLWCWIVRIC